MKELPEINLEDVNVVALNAAVYAVLGSQGGISTRPAVVTKTDLMTGEVTTHKHAESGHMITLRVADECPDDLVDKAIAAIKAHNPAVLTPAQTMLADGRKTRADLVARIDAELAFFRTPLAVHIAKPGGSIDVLEHMMRATADILAATHELLERENQT